jgi:hypothetical protein
MFQSGNAGIMESMPPDPDRFRSARHALRTRLVMAGVFAGAILALAMSVAFSWGGDVRGGGGGGSAELSDEAKAAFHSPAGSCLAWTQRDASDMHTVPCAQPHFFEVTGVSDVGDRFPRGVPAPSVPQWRDITAERCPKGAADYLGKQLDPHGKLTVSALRPAEDEWNDGDRQLRCVLQWAGPGGGLQPLTQPAKDVPQSNVWDAGTCLAIAGKGVGDPVDCGLPHSYEIVGKLDLRSKFGEGFPQQDNQQEWLDTQCSQVAQDYTGGTDLTAQKLILTWDLREQASWDAGSTEVNCKVAAKLPDGSGLSPVTGSIRKGPAPPEGPPQDGGGPPQDGGGPPQDGQQPGPGGG